VDSSIIPREIKGGNCKLKEYECVEVKHHKDISKIIEQYQRDGWSLNTYQTAGMGAGPMAYNVKHYLLFEKGK
jgi:hypothetical protein